ncbi:hypothetical protein R1sor_004908 [Riccia sorocarpa]|uniref:Reverse transcriptase domain-containing protein n=1 Tax=Riccia sorocarpa TaxID=122646 RepID=A0ABD3HLJ2_9MARC
MMEKNYILLQLDFRKAFDSVNWRCIMETLKVYGFGAGFQKNIEAILKTAASCIIINGKQSKPVRTTLSKANVHYCLGFYADDSHVIIKAEKACALRTRDLLDWFANATGLLIQWEKSTARWIGPEEGTKPQWVQELNWSWKERGHVTKLLGFSFEDGINAAEMLRRCKVKVNEICSSPLYNALSICGRIAVANASLLGAFCTWEKLKRNIQHRKLYTVDNWKEIALWGSSQEATDGKIRRIVSQARRTMWEAGYRRLEDLLDEEKKHLVAWENKKIPVAESKTVEKAYNRLLGLITAPNDNRLNVEEKVLRYYETKDQAGYIWAWKAKAGERQEAQTPPEEAERIRRFKVNGTWLQQCTAETQLRKEPIYKTAEVIAYRVGQGKILRARAEAFPEEASELARLRWKNGSDFFNASNGQIRKILTKDAEAIVNKMKKWTSIAEVTPENRRR